MQNHPNLFAVDNVKLALNLQFLCICYFCYFYKIVLLKAISFIATASYSMQKIVKSRFVNITLDRSENVNEIKLF